MERIITLDSPGAGYIRLLKGGKQLGVVYWANLDTKEYHRTALWMDFIDGPWEGGGRIVRHRADVTEMTHSTLHELDANDAGLAHLLPANRKYSIDQYPVVDYLNQYPAYGDPKANCRTTPLTVEGVFDEAVLGSNTSLEIQALFPDLKVDP